MPSALGFGAASTIVFILASGPGWLYVGRILPGLSAGLMTGAATAALTEMVRESASRRASLMATAANMGGAGLGPLMAGLFAQYGPQPTVLVFDVYLALLALAALALAFVPETVTRQQRLSLRFTGLEIPAAGRDEFIGAGLATFAAFALTGLFTSLAPGIVGSLLHQANHAVQGAVSCIIFAAATVAELGLARLNSRPVTLAGLGLSLAGLALIVAGLAAASLVLFLAGTVVGGIAAGAIFVGSLSIANRVAPQESRGQVIATYFNLKYANGTRDLAQTVGRSRSRRGRRACPATV